MQHAYSVPSKHDTSSQCLSNVGPPSTTLAQHWSTLARCVVFAGCPSAIYSLLHQDLCHLDSRTFIFIFNDFVAIKALITTTIIFNMLDFRLYQLLGMKRMLTTSSFANVWSQINMIKHI